MTIGIVCRPARGGGRHVIARCDRCGIVAERSVSNAVATSSAAIEALFHAGCRHVAGTSYAKRAPTLPDEEEIHSEPLDLDWIRRWENAVTGWFDDPAREEMTFGAPACATAEALLRRLRDAGYGVERTGAKISVKRVDDPRASSSRLRADRYAAVDVEGLRRRG